MDATDTLVEVLKGEGPRVLATLARTIGDLAVAEDALSEATITALDAWPKTGIPDNPRAWLAVVARRKALDLLRRESARAAKETAAFRWGTGAAPDQIEEAIEAMEPESSLRDDMLRLIFTCCHPALGREAQVALSLRTLARLEVPAIARAFLVPEATMAKRLVRARSKIATARIPYAIPSDTELPGRLASVLAVVYLVATEAHAPTGGDAVPTRYTTAGAAAVPAREAPCAEMAAVGLAILERATAALGGGGLGPRRGSCGRARWKIENETFNVLKTNGYNLEHSFGHGKQTLASVLLTLNLLAFAFHTAAWLAVLARREAVGVS